MKAVLFGAGGFLGRVVTRALLAAGWEVQAIRSLRELSGERANVADAESLRKLRTDAQVAINLAVQLPSSADTLADHPAMFAVNAVGAANVARWAADQGVGRLVLGSTLVVASKPWPTPLTEESPSYPVGPVAAYAGSKLGGELVSGSIARAAGLSFATLRFAAIYGPGMAWSGVLPAFIDAAIDGKRLRAADSAHADFLHVIDAAGAVACAAAGTIDGVVNVASGTETSIVSLARLVLESAGRSVDALDVAPSVVARAVVDVGRLRREVGFQAEIPLARGVSELLDLRRSERLR